MPFTFSHPAVILPATYLDKKYYCLSALIIGSMTPDFEYFIRMRDFSKYSHTWTGLFWFDIPLGLALLFLFHNVVRNTLIQYLPFSLNVRFSVFEKFNWNQYFRQHKLVVLSSLMVGIASHLLWDSFTHEGDYFTNLIPLLHDQYDFLGRTANGATLLQYTSSLVGCIIMIIYLFRFPEGRNTQKENILNFWLIVLLIMLMVLDVRFYVGSLFRQHLRKHVIVTLISGALIGIITLSLLLKKDEEKEIFRKLHRVRHRS